MHQRRPRPASEFGEGESEDDLRSTGSVTVRPETSASDLVTSFAKKAWSSPKVKAGIVLWLIGLSFMTFTPAFVKITPEMKDTYENMAVESTEQRFQYDDALAELSVAESKLYDSQVWFWRFRPEYKEIVDKRQAEFSVKQGKVDDLNAKRAEQQSRANSYIGIWSDYGMQDVKEKFWSSFEGGKVFAQRQTFWSMFHTLLTSRDEYFLSVLFRWVFMALINFTLGLLGSLFYFAYTLAYMILSYQPDPLSGLAFVLLSLLGGASIVATYLFGLYALAAGGVYVVGKVALKNMAIKYDQQQRLLRERGQQGQQGLRFKRQ